MRAAGMGPWGRTRSRTSALTLPKGRASSALSTSKRRPLWRYSGFRPRSWNIGRVYRSSGAEPLRKWGRMMTSQPSPESDESAAGYPPDSPTDEVFGNYERPDGHLLP